MGLTEFWPARERDRLGRQSPRALPTGALTGAVPGLAAQFAREVPLTHLVPGRPLRGRPAEVLAWVSEAQACPEAFAATHVHCTCGEFAPLVAPWAACPGECGRWFMPHGLGARVAGPYRETS